MWVLHLINKTNPETKRPYGVYKVKNEINNYYSCCWNFDLERSKNLIGGMIYLHNSKSEKSFFWRESFRGDSSKFRFSSRFCNITDR